MYKLSVITINFNNLDGLIKTVKSTLNQSFSNFEYIIIDGGSTDGSVEYLNSKSAYITYWKSEPDNGIYDAMNKGIKVSCGEYLLFLNSGDHFFNDKVLSNCISYLNGTDLIVGDLNYLRLEKSFIFEYPSIANIHWVYKYSLPHPSTFIQKKLFERVGYFNEKDRISSDWQFFMNSLFRHNCSYLKIPLTVSCFYADGISHKESSIQITQDEKKQFMSNSFSPLECDLLEFNSLFFDFFDSIFDKKIIRTLLKISFFKFFLGQKFQLFNDSKILIKKI